MGRVLAEGEAVKGWLLDHVHGQARPGVTPDLLVLNRVIEGLELMAHG